MLIKELVWILANCEECLQSKNSFDKLLMENITLLKCDNLTPSKFQPL